jgi:folate-binding protein YgfZ
MTLYPNPTSGISITMNTEWQQFLESKGAVIENGQVLHFGDPADEIRLSGDSAIVADLSHLGLIQFAGEDAQSFLQGQLSNDVKQLTASNSQLSSYCTAKGRMLANFLLWKNADDSYLMQLPASLREAVQKRLTLFVLRSKVKVTDVSDHWQRIGVAGPGAEDAVRNVLGLVPSANHEVSQAEGATLIRLPGNSFEILAAPERAQAIWSSLDGPCKPVSGGRWDWHMIVSGIPTVLPGTQEEFVPQMINFELVGGVNFKKGCYPGQEIVARTQYLGKLKRRMYLAQLASDTPPAAGDALFSSDLQEQASGIIVNAQPSPHGGHDVLAVIQTSSAESQPIHWKALDGPVLKLQPLPYEIPA